MILAVTGGTGFVGRALLALAQQRGLAVRALARSAQPATPGVAWVRGDLADTGALAALVAGADAIIHVAGVTNARSRAEFDRGNSAGTAAMLDAAAGAGVRRFVHVSSLAAREPALSHYGASKAAAEALVTASRLDWTLVRPPAVYGPGDPDTLGFYQMVARGIAVLPGPGRFSAIEVGDLAAALLAIAAAPAAGRTWAVDDGTPGGHDYAALARAIGAALGVTPRLVRLPPAALHLGATVDTALARVRGRLPRLSFDRARYIAHPDWVVAEGDRPPPELWAPRIGLTEGVRATAEWYRAQGWL